ncbi:MAG: butyrate kinase [Salinivirgaceae bacterium]|nr:butyrate kinase [Salinivirgaceae bacterium]
MSTEAVIVINPGSTSTKIAVYSRDAKLFSENLNHNQSDLDAYKTIGEQLDFRLHHVRSFINPILKENDLKIVGTVGRGGIVKALLGGTYRINEAFLKDALSCEYGEHASNLGSVMAHALKDDFGLETCYTVDPVSVNNMSDVAEISGVPQIKRVGRGHPLNIKMTARKIAKIQNISFEEANYIVAHLGGGISITHLLHGQLVDINDGLLGMGPFSPNRAGSLPVRGIMRICYDMPKYDAERLFAKNSGFQGYLGTEDMREVLKLIANGNKKAKLIYDAFVYQVAKEIGAYFVASKCKAQAIIITGGIAYNEPFINDLKEYVGALTEFHVFPGENEMEALAEGAFRVIDGEEQAQEY